MTRLRVVRVAVAVLVALVWAGAAAAGAEERVTVALPPFDNVSGTVSAARIVMPLVAQVLGERGYRVLGPDRLEPFLTRQRIRNTGELSRAHLAELRKEHGAALALVGSVAIFNDSPANPQWGLSARLLAADSAEILWADAAGLTGDDFTIALGLGTITSAERLAGETVRAALRDLPGPGEAARRSPEGRGWRPRLFGRTAAYRSPTLESAPPRRVAVLPFENLSERKGAGRIVTDLATVMLVRHGRFAVVEPGAVSEALRGIGAAPYGQMDFDTLRALRGRLEADAVILGTVFTYSEGLKKAATTVPEIALDARMLDVETGRILWVAEGARNGEDSRIAMHFGSIRAMVPLVERVLRELLGTL